MQQRRKPVVSLLILCIITAGCALEGVFSSYDPGALDLKACNLAPSLRHWFGTDSLGRDLFAEIWHGGRISLSIGVLSAAISTVIAFLYGAISGMAGQRQDHVMMRFCELFLSIPAILPIVFVLGVTGGRNIWSLALAIGLTDWCNMAKVVRGEIRQSRGCDYVAASRCLGGSRIFIAWYHLLPGCMSSVMFMSVCCVRNAILLESTLSFMGLGLDVSMISWGSMLSLAGKAFLTGSWWVIVFPGLFLVTFLLSLTLVADYLRRLLNPGTGML